MIKQDTFNTKVKTSGQKILRSTALVMGLTLVAKVSGLLRDIIVASQFGTSQAMDAFFVAVTIAGLIFVWLKDPIQVVLVPLFTKDLASRGQQSAWETASILMNTLLLLFVILAGAGWFVAPYLSWAVAPGFSAQTHALSADLTRFMMLSVLFLGLSRLLSALYYAHQRFGSPGVITAADNLVAIVLIIAFVPVLGVYALMLGAVVGAAIQVVVQLPILWQHRSFYKPRIDFQNPALRKMAWISIPLLIGTGGAELSRISDRIFASLLPVGSLSALAYGQRLTYAMFFQLFVASLATVLFPFFSRSAGVNDYHDLGRKLFSALRILFWIVLPLSVGLMLLHEPLVRLVYQRGAFSEESVRLTSQAVFFYAIGLSVYSLSSVLSYAFYSVQDTRTPVVIGLVRLGVKIGLSIVLVRFMAHAGLALAESLSFVVKAVLLLCFLPRQLPRAEYRRLWRSFGLTAVVTGGMAAIMILALPQLQQLFVVESSFRATSTGLGIAIALGVFSYLLLSLLLQRGEVKDVYRLVRAGLARS